MTTILSDHCKEPGHEKFNLMEMADGTIQCPRCWREKQDALELEQNTKWFEEQERRSKHAYLVKNSLISDNTLKEAGFKNYITKEPEELENKNKMIGFVKKYQAGETFNIWLMGDPGVGKSHLSMATLKNLNETGVGSKCLYISISAMLRKIKAGFDLNWEEKKKYPYTEDKMVELLGSVDYLVLDDVGSETGSIGADKRATNYTHKILYDVMELRQDKSTILTTNLSWNELETIYDSKVISRMRRNIEVIEFIKTTDKRLRGASYV